MVKWIFPFFLGSIWGAVNQNNDVQLWISNALLKPVTTRCSFYLVNEWRFGDEISRLYYVYLQGNLRVSLTDQIDIAPGYRQNWNWQQSGWRLENEPMFELYFHSKDFIQLRNRISYVIRQQTNNIWQYRGRLRINFTDWQIRPFVSNEVFVITHDGFSQDRAIAGISAPLFSQSRADLYYMLRFLKSTGHWTHQHILGFWCNWYF